jgi:TRAP-type transport system periplasmic protein
MINRRQMLASAAGAAVFAPAIVRAETAWDMATSYTDGTFHTQNIRWFLEQVASTTSNALKVQLHTNNTLIRGPEILRAVSAGQVAAGEILLSQFGNDDPILEVDAIPFLIQGFDEARALGEVSRAAVEASLQKRGVRALYMVPWPSQAFYSKTPIASAADMKGMKFRTGSPMTSRMAELLGAVPTAVQGSDIPQAFATNIVTGMVTSAATGVQSRAWEFSTHFIDLKAFQPKNAVIVNERAWQRLPETVKAAMTAQSKTAEERGWKLAGEAETSTVEELRKQGMTVSQPADALRADVRAVGAKLTDEWIAKAGEGGKKVIDAYRARVKT